MITFVFTVLSLELLSVEFGRFLSQVMHLMIGLLIFLRGLLISFVRLQISFRDSMTQSVMMQLLHLREFLQSFLIITLSAISHLRSRLCHVSVRDFCSLFRRAAIVTFCD